MKEIIIWAIIFIVLLPTTLLYGNNQETKGDYSPIQNIGPGGTGNINIIINNYNAEMNKKTKEFWDELDKYRKARIGELSREMAEYYIQQTGSPSEDATKWVQDAIEKAPILKNEREKHEESRVKYNEEITKDLVSKVYRLFGYIIETVDARFDALCKINTKVKYEKENIFNLFKEDKFILEHYVMRKLILPNNNHILITCFTGDISQGIIKTCPSLRFTETIGNNIMQSFEVKPNYGGGTLTLGDGNVPLMQKPRLNNVEYMATGKTEPLTETIKKQFDLVFEELFKIAVGR